MKEFFAILEASTNKKGGLMKKVIFLLFCLVLVFFNSCSNDEFIDANKTEVETDLSFEEVSTLHSSVLDCAEEILKEQKIEPSQMTSSQRYVVTQDAVLRGTQRYISQKEGRTLTAAEEATLQKEVSDYWNDTNNRALMKKFAYSSSPISPTTGSPELRVLYQNFKIKPVAQGYLNPMFANIGSPNYTNYLDQLTMKVRSEPGLTQEDKTSLLNTIAVTKDSYNYWTKKAPYTRMSAMVKAIIICDAVGAVKGIWKGVGRSIGNLIFGPGGAVLTITGSVIVNAAVSSVEGALTEGLMEL